MSFYIFLERSPTLLKLNLYMKTTPQGSSSHMYKDFPLRGSLTKDYKVFTIMFIIISTFYFFKASYSHMIFLHVLIATNNMKLLNANYEPKAPISTPYILYQKKWMNSQPHSSTSIPHVSNQSSCATYNFSSFYG